MSASPCISSVDAFSKVSKQEGFVSFGESKKICHFTCWGVISVLAVVACLVPEKPDELASICQRHNSEIGCRVW